MRGAADVGPLELAEYQRAARLVLRPPLITASSPDRTALPLARKWARQLRADFAEVLGYTLVSTGGTIRLRRVQDTLDTTRPVLTRGRRALGGSGSQVALSELADAVAAEAGRIDGLGMDTGRKADRDAFVDAVAWLEALGATRLGRGRGAHCAWRRGRRPSGSATPSAPRRCTTSTGSPSRPSTRPAGCCST